MVQQRCPSQHYFVRHLRFYSCHGFVRFNLKLILEVLFEIALARSQRETDPWHRSGRGEYGDPVQFLRWRLRWLHRRERVHQRQEQENARTEQFRANSIQRLLVWQLKNLTKLKPESQRFLDQSVDYFQSADDPAAAQDDQGDRR